MDVYLNIDREERSLKAPNVMRVPRGHTHQLILKFCSDGRDGGLLPIGSSIALEMFEVGSDEIVDSITDFDRDAMRSLYTASIDASIDSPLASLRNNTLVARLRYTPHYPDWTSGSDYAIGEGVTYDGDHYDVVATVTDSTTTPDIDESAFVANTSEESGEQITAYWHVQLPSRSRDARDQNRNNAVDFADRAGGVHWNNIFDKPDLDPAILASHLQSTKVELEESLQEFGSATKIYDAEGKLIDHIYGDIPSSWQYYNNDIKTIICGSSTQKIGSEAFYGCGDINVDLNNVTHLGTLAFYYNNIISLINYNNVIHGGNQAISEIPLAKQYWPNLVSVEYGFADGSESSKLCLPYIGNFEEYSFAHYNKITHVYLGCNADVLYDDFWSDFKSLSYWTKNPDDSVLYVRSQYISNYDDDWIKRTNYTGSIAEWTNWPDLPLDW